MSTNVLNPIRKNGHFYTCEEKDSGLSDEEQERKVPKNRPKHTNTDTSSREELFVEIQNSFLIR